MKNILTAFKVFIFSAFLIGIVYEGLLTYVGKTVFPYNAGGSLIEKDGKIIGSELIAQQFLDPRYFSRRLPDNPSIEGPSRSVVSSLPTTTDKFKKRQIDLRESTVETYNNEIIPSDFITASGSGVDPHISKEAAYYQIGAVALERNVPAAIIKSIVDELVEEPFMYIWGQERVNVLKLNLELDRKLGVIYGQD